ncbi:MAG TPA: hypothetical protein GX391_02865 [Firmicutes bacterium]|nr:hypothetical protein [Bacillota bacterium]HOQ23922.1 hypothetical protein [Bacillota bacterium]HPT67174.1 hypothetical protein [Bacillota bacterium]
MENMEIAVNRGIFRTLLHNIALLLLLLVGGLAAKGGGVVGVLAGWSISLLNRRSLLCCLGRGNLPSLPARLRRNTVGRMVMSFAALAIIVKMVPAAFGWAVGAWLTNQTIWFLSLAGLMLEKGDG